MSQYTGDCSKRSYQNDHSRKEKLECFKRHCHQQQTQFKENFLPQAVCTALEKNKGTLMMLLHIRHSPNQHQVRVKGLLQLLLSPAIHCLLHLLGHAGCASRCCRSHRKTLEG